MNATMRARTVFAVMSLVMLGATVAPRTTHAQPRAATLPPSAPHAEAARPVATGASATAAQTPSRDAPPPATMSPGGQTVTAQTPLHRGDFVAIEWHGTWYAGHVVALANGNTVRAHYDGYDSSQDETVPRTRLQLNPAAFRPRPGAIEPMGTPVYPTTAIPPGMAVEINWHGQWWAGHTVAALSDGAVVVRYDGYEASADEIVTRDRLQLARPGVAPSPAAATLPSAAFPPGRPVDAQAPLGLGDAVHIEWSGSFYPGRVVALLDNGQVRAHYLGYGNDSDENVPRTRLRLGVARRVIIAPPQ